MIRKDEYSTIGVLAGFSAGFVGVGFLWLSTVLANPHRVANAQLDAITQITQWASDSINAVFDTIPEEFDAWLGIRWYDEQSSGNWTTEPPAEIPVNAVVLIHGLDEPGGIWDELAPALHNAGHAVIRFEYPNDQRIGPSAYVFAQSLNDLGQLGVERIDIVAHSMGGLVAREVLSNEKLHMDGSPSTRRLITLGTPHLGSPWSRMRAVAEAREHIQRWIESPDHDPKRLLGFARDGVGRAGTDLLPGSDFLNTLNARPMPGGVAVTCVVGRAVPFRQSDARVMVGSGVLEQIVGQRDAKAIEQGLAILKAELGDGVVPVSSAVMPGATDIVIVQANHRSMVRTVELDEAIKKARNIPQGPPPPAIAVILDRLKDADD